MTIAVQEPVQQRMFSGYSSPGLPAGVWVCRVRVIGNVSGGTRSVDAVFQLATAPRASQFYSLEHLTIADTDNNAKAGDVVSSIMDRYYETSLLKNWNMNLVAGLNRASPDPVALQQLKGVFLGQPSDAGLTASLNFQTTNVDGAFLDFIAEGYYWTARSILTEGGLRKPADGLYS